SSNDLTLRSSKVIHRVCKRFVRISYDQQGKDQTFRICSNGSDTGRMLKQKLRQLASIACVHQQLVDDPFHDSWGRGELRDDQTLQSFFGESDWFSIITPCLILHNILHMTSTQVDIAAGEIPTALNIVLHSSMPLQSTKGYYTVGISLDKDTLRSVVNLMIAYFEPYTGVNELYPINNDLFHIARMTTGSNLTVVCVRDEERPLQELGLTERSSIEFVPLWKSE
ncbi:MAG TPA: hypothetical protein VJ508_14890, partial [Saprospiraceae bacterium]|nr:hypothetical protein [Saprospiraceae bacterium]